MSNRKRGFLLAISNEADEPAIVPVGDQIEYTAVEPVVIDPDHPDTLQDLSLHEYAHLVRQADNEVQFADEGQVSQEGLSESVQNFKSWFKQTMSKDLTYIDSLRERYKALVQRIQASNEKQTSPTPVSMFGEYAEWLEHGGKLAQNPNQILTEIGRMAELNNAIDKHFLPSFAAEIKFAMECLAIGASDVDAAYKKIYTINKVNDPLKGFESILSQSGLVTLGSGKKVTSKESVPYFGSMVMIAYPLGDSASLGIDRGHELVTDTSSQWKKTDKIQLTAASRDELKKIADLAVKVLDTANGYLDKMLGAERNMLIDKINSFENAHRNWRNYPPEERRKLVTLMHASDTTTERVNVVHDVLYMTRKSLHAIERYIELCLKRLN